MFLPNCIDIVSRSRLDHYHLTSNIASERG